MDINSVLHLISSQIEKVIGILAAFFIGTTILLLIRSLKNKSDEDGGTDVASIESALKRVLSQTPGIVTGEKTAVKGASEASDVDFALEEKEHLIANLQGQLQKAQADLRVKQSEPGAAVTADPAVDTGALQALEKQIQELKARLAEYEIIEDDIADLAVYKEENAKLKQEIDEIKSGLGGTPMARSAPASDPIAEVPAPEAPVPPLPPIELKPEIAMEPEAPLAAVDPAGLGSFLDPQKIMQEAAAMANAPAAGEATDALSDLLDTDKLLAEVSALDAEDLMSEFKAKDPEPNKDTTTPIDKVKGGA